MYAGQQMLALVRIGGSKLNGPIERIRRSFGKERGTILQPGPGLWAVSSGAARRGVWHRIREDADPVRQALRSMGLPSNLVRTVDKIEEEVYEGGRLCKHLSYGGSSSWFLSDGEAEHLEDACYVTRENCSGNQYHIGCSDGPARKRVTGGTYLITGADVSRSDIRSAHPTVRQVLVTPAAEREFVAKLVKTGGSYDEVVGLEIEYGLRCPECRLRGCAGPSRHEADREAEVLRQKERAEDEAGLFVRFEGARYRVLARCGWYIYERANSHGSSVARMAILDDGRGGNFAVECEEWVWVGAWSFSEFILMEAYASGEETWRLDPRKGKNWVQKI